MARKPRVVFARALAHLIRRGHRRQVISRSNAARQCYLDRLEPHRERYGFKVYAFVLMSNYVYPLIGTGRAVLSKKSLALLVNQIILNKTLTPIVNCDKTAESSYHP
jgi:REP element-mobilizing transposase RayT